MLANLAKSLFEHGRITTTEAKAKRLRPLAEKLITFAKRGDLHARRQVLAAIGANSQENKNVVHRLFEEIGPRYADRPGGYTRITKLGPRKGDNAPMVKIELVEALADSPKAKKAAAKKAPAKKVAAKAEEAPVVEDEAKVEDVVTEDVQDVVEDAKTEDK